MSTFKPVTAKTFRYWLLQARTGEELVYYTGDLQRDRVLEAVDLEDGLALVVPIKVVDALARAVWDAYERGEVTLKQRRLAPHYYEYIARRRFAARRAAA